MEDWKFNTAKDLALGTTERWRSLRRESGLVSTGCHIAWWSLIQSYLSIWHRLQVIGKEHLPAEPPFVLVANHTSHLDAIVLASQFSWHIRNRIFPIAAGDVFFESTWLAAFSAHFLNALPMWRKKSTGHALQELRNRLCEEPAGYILFPEGARSRTGELLPFKLGLGMLIAETNVPIIPCYLHGCYEALPAGHKIPLRKPIHLHVAPALNFAQTPNTKTGWQAISDQLTTAIQDLQREHRK